jgi:hypothetical protein
MPRQKPASWPPCFAALVNLTALSPSRERARQAVEEALAAARAQLDRAHAEGKRTLFLFYYSGHGDQEALELGSSRLPLRDLRSYLEQLPGLTCAWPLSTPASRARSPA